MGRCPLLAVIVLLLGVVALVNGSSNATSVKSEVGSVTYLDVLRRITNLRGADIRNNLRSLRQLAIQHGLIKRSAMDEGATADSNEEESLEGEESSMESQPGQDLTTIAEGRKKGGGGGGSNNNIVVAGGGGGGHDDGSYSISIEEGGNKKGKKGKKSKKGKKHRKQKKKGWKKHMKKAVPIGMGILALKALLLHFLLKKLVMATALSLLLSKKSLLVSSLIALKLLLQQPHSSDKSESSKLEVVHIPIRKDAGFHKKHQQQQVPSGKMKLPSIGTSAPTTTKAPSSPSLSLFDSYAGSSPHQIQHSHQQMADFGGKYIPLGYESNHFHFDATPSVAAYGDGLSSVQNVEQFFDDADELQFDRQDNGWDGWSGWNRGERFEQTGASAPASGVVSSGGGAGVDGTSNDASAYAGWGGTVYRETTPAQQTDSTYGPLNRSRYSELFDGYRRATQANNPPRLHQLMGRRKRKF